MIVFIRMGRRRRRWFWLRRFRMVLRYVELPHVIRVVAVRAAVNSTISTPVASRILSIVRQVGCNFVCTYVTNTHAIYFLCNEMIISSDLYLDVWNITYIVSGSMIDSSIRISRPQWFSVSGSSRWISITIADWIVPSRSWIFSMTLITSPIKRIVVLSVVRMSVDYRRPSMISVIERSRNLVWWTSIEIQGSRHFL